MGISGGGDWDKVTITNNNIRRRMNRRVEGREDTSLGCDVICRTGVEVPVMLGGLLKLQCLELGR